MAWFTPSGQPLQRSDTSAQNPPHIDIQVDVGGTPMFREDYAPHSESVVTESERVQGREAWELHDGLRLLGKDINSAGLADNKFLKYDADNGQWVIADATGTADLADLNDVEDGTPSTFDTLAWGGSEWNFLSGISTAYLQQPIGNNFTVGTLDSATYMKIQGGTEAHDKKLSFGWTDNDTYTEQWKLGNESATTFSIKDKDGHACLTISEADNKVTMERMRLNDQATRTAESGALYYNATDNVWYMAIDDGSGGGGA